MGSDATEQDERRQALDETMLRAMADASPDSIFIKGRDRRYVFVNREMCRLFGCAPDDLLGYTPEDLFDPDSAETVREVDDRTFAGEVMRVERELVIGDNLHVFSAVQVPLRDEGGHVHAICGFVTDVTALRNAQARQQELERQMLHAQKLESLGVLAGGIAHDFNNILVSVQGHANLAMADLPPDHRSRASIARIEQGARRASELCDQLLAYSGRGARVVAPLDLNPLLLESLGLLRLSISKRALLDVDVAPEQQPVIGNASQVRQVLVNLLTNASEALGQDEGTIHVRTRTTDLGPGVRGVGTTRELTPGTYCMIEVEDSGAGMDAQTLSRIFDPFFTTKFTGRGLGLSAVLGIVQGHGGGVQVWSTPGAGTRFRVLLPRTTMPLSVHPTVPARRAPTGAHAGALILVVDDEESNRDVVRLMLERGGYRVRTADDGEAGVAAVREASGDIDAIVLDLAMPRMGGEEALEAIRSIRPDVPVVVMSGYSEQEIGEIFPNGTISSFLHKPFCSTDLLARVAEALASARPPSSD